MSAVMFIACIPTRDHEKELNPILSSEKKKNKPNVKISNGSRDVSLEMDEQVSLLADEEEESTATTTTTSPRSERDDSKQEDKKDETSEKKKKKLKMEVAPDSCMEEILTCILKSLKIEHYSWQPTKDDKFIHVMFSVTEGPPFEEALHVLTKWGIGVRCKSTLGIVPCALYFRSVDCEHTEDEESTSVKGKESSKSGWDEFVLSVVRSRLAVAQVVESVKGSAKLTFDFVCLIILAGTIAAVGLAENSTVSIVASMLISPLMGPILAGTFGTIIHDRKLQLMGVRNELIGLALTILVGFFFGLIIGSFEEFQNGKEWPTQEMMSRGLLRSLWVGILIALPSGAGVALGLLNDNSGSLIGVAISASLLPPAVNAGLFWALSALTSTQTMERRNGTEHIYSNHLPTEYALLGCVSLSLTLVNIICIFISGIGVLRAYLIAQTVSVFHLLLREDRHCQIPSGDFGFPFSRFVPQPCPKLPPPIHRKAQGWPRTPTCDSGTHHQEMNSKNSLQDALAYIHQSKILPSSFSRDTVPFMAEANSTCNPTWIKEVAPRALTDEVQQFWHHDIKVARDYNRSISREDAKEFEKQLAQELAAITEDRDPTMTVSPGEDYAAFRRRLSSMYHFSPDTIRRISVGPRRLSQTTWSPGPSAGLDYHRRSSVKDLEKLYASLGGSEPPRLSSAWKVAAAQLRSGRGKQQEEGSALSPIIENSGGGETTPEGGRRSSYLPLRRNPRNHRFTVIPSACDPLKNKP